MQVSSSRIIDKIRALLLMWETPGAYSARRAGCYLNIYSVLHRLRTMGVNPQTVIDIGANRGHYSRTVRYVFPDAAIYAFEPLKECFAELSVKSLSISKMKCYNVALGSSAGSSVIYQSEYDFSSSLLEMDNLHKEAFPHTAKSTSQKIQIMKLDDVLANEDLGQPILTKIDVQGFEASVIDGGQAILQKSKWLICEVSFMTLYKSQPLFDEMYKTIVGLGFEFVGQLGDVTHPVTKQMLQADCLFIRG